MEPESYILILVSILRIFYDTKKFHVYTAQSAVHKRKLSVNTVLEIPDNLG